MIIKSVSEMFRFKEQLKKGTEVEVFLWARWCQGKVIRINKTGKIFVHVTEFHPIKVEGAFEPSEVRPVGGWALKVNNPDEKNAVGPKTEGNQEII